MSDSDIIQTAYADTLTDLFSIYFDALSASNGDTQADAVATAHFKRGIALARQARDQALQLVQ